MYFSKSSEFSDGRSSASPSGNQRGPGEAGRKSKDDPTSIMFMFNVYPRWMRNQSAINQSKTPTGVKCQSCKARYAAGSTDRTGERRSERPPKKCCQTHNFLQISVLIQPRTSPPKNCKIYNFFLKKCKISGFC